MYIKCSSHIHLRYFNSDVHEMYIRLLADKYDVIAQQCTAVASEKQKLLRRLNTERGKATGMIERVSELEAEVKGLGEVRVALEFAEMELATANRAIASLKRVVAQEKKQMWQRC